MIIMSELMRLIIIIVIKIITAIPSSDLINLVIFR